MRESVEASINFTKLENAGVIAVVRGKTKEEALKASQAIVAGGMRGIELTFTVPQATEVIQELVALYQENPDVVIGAGQFWMLRLLV